MLIKIRSASTRYYYNYASILHNDKIEFIQLERGLYLGGRGYNRIYFFVYRGFL